MMARAAGPNLAFGDTWISPRSGRALVWDTDRAVFTTADGRETFGCVAGEIPDFRDAQPAASSDEVELLRKRLRDRWEQSERSPVLRQAMTPASVAEARRYWWLTTKSEIVEYVRWCLAGRRKLTQQHSIELYRAVTDVYPAALRGRVTVLAGGRVATTTLMEFKRLSLEPVLNLVQHEGVRTALDFGCGWGANTIVLRQRVPELHVLSFDVSPERVLSAEFNLRSLALVPYRLFVADGSRLPLADDSVDLVFTTHVLEQVREALPRALREIHRVAGRFAIHVEPTYRWARSPHRLRMQRLGYPRDIAEQAVACGFRLLEHRLANPGWGRTPAEVMVLEKR